MGEWNTFCQNSQNSPKANHAIYEALEFVNGATSITNPKSGLRLLKAYSEGYRQDWELPFYDDTVKPGGWYGVTLRDFW
ncbi:unnamed protein product [Calypogeia fissa]